MTEYIVTATTLYQLLPDGSEKRRRQGDIVTDLSDDDVARHLSSGGIVPVSHGAPAEMPEPSSADPGTGDGGEPKPPRDATNPVLAKWLLDNAEKEDGSAYTAKELKAMNKAKLLALIDSKPD